MKVTNLTSPQGNAVPNQFIIEDKDKTVFQSYKSVICVKQNGTVTLDKKFWDYSNTTGKYRNIFLGETKKETQAKIDKGIYKLDDLN